MLACWDGKVKMAVARACQQTTATSASSPARHPAGPSFKNLHLDVQWLHIPWQSSCRMALPFNSSLSSSGQALTLTRMTARKQPLCAAAILGLLLFAHCMHGTDHACAVGTSYRKPTISSSACGVGEASNAISRISFRMCIANLFVFSHTQQRSSTFEDVAHHCSSRQEGFVAGGS